MFRKRKRGRAPLAVRGHSGAGVPIRNTLAINVLRQAVTGTTGGAPRTP
jgi:hypothetical protein